MSAKPTTTTIVAVVLTIGLFTLYSPLPAQSQSVQQTTANLGVANIFTLPNQFTLGAQVGPVSYAALSTLTPSLDLLIGCLDCQQTNPCVSGGSGAIAVGTGTAWSCSAVNGTSNPGNQGALQGNNSGVFAGLPGSTMDFTNGLLSLAPTGTGPSLSITGDAIGDNIMTAHVHGSSNVLAINSSGYIAMTGATSGSCVKADGTGWGACGGGGGSVTGSGTANYIPIWTGSSALGNSYLFQQATGTNQGITLQNTLSSGTVTNVYGLLADVYTGNGSNTGSVTNQYGIQVRDLNNGSGSDFTITNSSWIDINYANVPGTLGVVTNDYGLYVDAVPSNGFTNHSGIYIGDQGADNNANSTWFAINVQSQSVGPGYTKPTVVINMGGVYHYSGSGAPTFNCGGGSTPSVYWRTDAPDVSHLEYLCVSGTSWTAVTVP